MRTTPLRLLIVTQNFPQRLIAWSGEFLVRQARMLARHEIECLFVVPRTWAPWPFPLFDRWRHFGPENPLLDVEGLRAQLVPYLRPPGLWFYRHEHRTMRAPVARVARRWHAERPIDVVLGVQMGGEAATAAWLGRALGIPTASLAIGTDVMLLPDRAPGFGQMLAATLAEVDLPIAVSEAVASRLEATGACSRPPLVVRMPRDESEFRPAEDREAIRAEAGIAPDEVVAVYVGRLEPAKGMRELHAVAARLLARHASFRLLCLGDGSERARLLSLASIRPGAIEAPGRVAPSDVPRALQAADLLVLPSHSEGLPQVVVEAMNCGLPVVATDVGGTREAVLDEQTGLLVPPRDEDALEAALERLIVDADLRRRLARRGVEWAREAFDSTRNSERLARALTDLAAH